MQPRSIAVVLVAALLAVSAGAGGALAVTDSLHAQQSPTGTSTTGGSAPGTSSTGGSATATTGSATATPTTSGSASGTTTTGGSASGTSGPSVTFNDQNSSGETVLVKSATLPKGGFVAIYDSTRSGNDTNQVIGASYPLSAGTSDNIRIQLDQPINSSKSLTAVVHTDSNGNDKFDFVASNGQQDPPLTQGGSRIVDIAQVTVEGASGNAGAATDSASNGGGAATDAGGEATEASGNDSGGANGSGGSSSSFGPGFGLAIAVVALLAVALLATRRN